jgi:dTDP-glucose 4,6-dehydratase
VRRLVGDGHDVVTVDNLTYAGNLDSLAGARAQDSHTFDHADIADADVISRIFERHRPRAVFHLAAESHVDRSIDAPGVFIRTNVVGTFHLGLRRWQQRARLDLRR